MLLAFMGFGVAFFQFVAPWVYGSVLVTAAAFGVVVGLSVLVDRATRARVDRRTAMIEFQG